MIQKKLERIGNDMLNGFLVVKSLFGWNSKEKDEYFHSLVLEKLVQQEIETVRHIYPNLLPEYLCMHDSIELNDYIAKLIYSINLAYEEKHFNADLIRDKVVIFCGRNTSVSVDKLKITGVDFKEEFTPQNRQANLRKFVINHIEVANKLNVKPSYECCFM